MLTKATELTGTYGGLSTQLFGGDDIWIWEWRFKWLIKTVSLRTKGSIKTSDWHNLHSLIWVRLSGELVTKQKVDRKISIEHLRAKSFNDIKVSI